MLDILLYLLEVIIGLYMWIEVILLVVDIMFINVIKIGIRVDFSCIECMEFEKRCCRNVFENFI